MKVGGNIVNTGKFRGSQYGKDLGDDEFLVNVGGNFVNSGGWHLEHNGVVTEEGLKCI